MGYRTLDCLASYFSPIASHKLQVAFDLVPEYNSSGSTTERGADLTRLATSLLLSRRPTWPAQLELKRASAMDLQVQDI